MKKFVLGFMCAALLFTALPIGAAIEEYICYKADYKVVVNGAEYINDELPVLNYKGNTYAPFRSILEAAGLTVGWNAELNQAEVTAPITSTAPTKEGNATNETTVITQTPDGITRIDTWEGKQYIGYLEVRLKARENGYDFISDLYSETWKLVKGNEVIIDNVPMTTLAGYGCDAVAIDYYIDTIMPIISKGAN